MAGLWISEQEIDQLPTSGPAWDAVEREALRASWGPPGSLGKSMAFTAWSLSGDPGEPPPPPEPEPEPEPLTLEERVASLEERVAALEARR